MAEERGVVKYRARDGQELTLGFETVRQYLVSGKKELVTPQELMFFMGVCKSRGLNPFKKDAYLIKYNEDPAAIVTSIDYYRARARAQADCRGWKAGIVLQKGSALEYREGSLILEGEKLVGGWFEATPDGWTVPRKHSVSLKGFIKKTRSGEVTRFWQEDNQPSQIMKVAESQGLRMVWPDEFQQMFSEEEVLPEKADMDQTMLNAEAAAGSQKAELPAPAMTREDVLAKFLESAPDQVDAEMLSAYLGYVAQTLSKQKGKDVTVDQVREMAVQPGSTFWKAYAVWLKKQTGNGGEKKPATEKPKTRNCPNTGNEVLEKTCAECRDRVGCPA